MKKLLKSRISVSVVMAILLCSVSLSSKVGAKGIADYGNDPKALTYPLPLASVQGGQGTFSDSVLVERESIDRYVQRAREYNDKFEVLARSSRSSLKDIQDAEAKLRRLKADFPKFQSDFRSYISKTKATGKWTPALDSEFESSATKHGISNNIIQMVKNYGGLRSFTEKLQAALPKLSAGFGGGEQELIHLRTKAVGLLDQPAGGVDARVVPVALASSPLRLGFSRELVCVTSAILCTTCTTTFVLVVVEAGEKAIGLAPVLKELVKCSTYTCGETVKCISEAVGGLIT